MVKIREHRLDHIIEIIKEYIEYCDGNDPLDVELLEYLTKLQSKTFKDRKRSES